MNTNPLAKRILCFGDSNTYGTIPYPFAGAKKERYPANIRRTGITQNILGDGYEIIEEGRGGRTIFLPGTSGDDTKRGSLFLEGLLASHLPLDLVIVMLGSNDVKDSLALSPQQICDMLESYIIPQVLNKNISLLLISPPPIIDDVRKNFPAGSHTKIVELNRLYSKLAEKYGFHYLDVQNQLICGSDGVHLSTKSHTLFGQKIPEKIKKLYI